MKSKKGMVGMIIGLIIAIIALVAVAIPITQSVIKRVVLLRGNS